MYAFLWDHDGINFQNVPFKNEKEAGAGLSPNAQILTCMQFVAEHNGANYLYAQRAGEARQFLESAGLTDLFSGILSPETLSFPLQPAPVKQTETCRPNDLRPSDCMLISDREDRLAAAKLIGVTSCYLAEDVIFRLKDVNSDYYCANSGHLLSLIRYRYAPRAAFRARRTANREYPGCVLFRITEPSCSPSTSSCPYDYESYYAIDVRTGTPLYVSHSARPMGHGYDSDTFVKPVSFDVVQNFADIRADTWRSRIGEARIAEALAKAEKERHAPVPLSPLPKKR